MDGAAVTQLRTAAASALASSYLSRPDSRDLVILGTGALALYLARAHAAVRPLQRIRIWGRNLDRAAATAAKTRELVGDGVDVASVEDAATAVARADIVLCATSSPIPMLQGAWLRSGAHIDHVGSFSPDKREADDAAVSRACIFVDTFEGALSEAGDLLQPLKKGVIARAQIEGELADLVTGRAAGRRVDDEITLFKSVETAVEDLAAAQFVHETARRIVAP